MFQTLTVLNGDIGVANTLYVKIIPVLTHLESFSRQMSDYYGLHLEYAHTKIVVGLESWASLTLEIEFVGDAGWWGSSDKHGLRYLTPSAEELVIIDDHLFVPMLSAPKELTFNGEQPAFAAVCLVEYNIIRSYTWRWEW